MPGCTVSDMAIGDVEDPAVYEWFKFLFEERQGVVSTEYHAMYIRQCASGLSEDQFVNNFTFLADDDKATAADDIAAALTDFYDTPGTTAAIAAWYHPCVTNAVTMKIYKLSDAKPREPIVRAYTTAVARVNTVGLPEECAIVLSFSAAPPHTARRRGRIFLGPLNQASISPEAGTSVTRVSGPLTVDIAAAAVRLANRVDAGWLIHSTMGTGSFAAVETGWIDNALDTQRRRGPKATSRYTWAKS